MILQLSLHSSPQTLRMSRSKQFLLDPAKQEASLEELRDLAVEIEGEDVEGTERDKLSGRPWRLSGLKRSISKQAKSDLEESLEQQKGNAETLAAFVVAAGIDPTKRARQRKRKREAQGSTASLRAGLVHLWTDHSNDVMNEPVISMPAHRTNFETNELLRIRIRQSQRELQALQEGSPRRRRIPDTSGTVRPSNNHASSNAGRHHIHNHNDNENMPPDSNSVRDHSKSESIYESRAFEPHNLIGCWPPLSLSEQSSELRMMSSAHCSTEMFN
ncbi:hypothetical protein DFH09DRAFT_1281617 [Mycena vulgaris]|nr:hypothetical protein DFH09DRAFT_1281617 [Mycena vulgaris]